MVFIPRDLYLVGCIDQDLQKLFMFRIDKK